MTAKVSKSNGAVAESDFNLKFENVHVEETDPYDDIPFEIPRTVDALYLNWDGFIHSRLLRYGMDNSEAIKDLKQAIYAHFHEKQYLPKYDPTKGSFKNFLTVGVRNYLFNWYNRQTRNPLRWADSIVESLGDEQELRDGYVSLELLDDFRDNSDRGEIFDATMILQELEEFLQAQREQNSQMINGMELSPWHVFNCWREGYRTKDMAQLWGITAGAISNYKRYIRESLKRFQDTGEFMPFEEFHA